jgi:hypothetical protein
MVTMMKPARREYRETSEHAVKDMDGHSLDLSEASTWNTEEVIVRSPYACPGQKPINTDNSQSQVHSHTVRAFHLIDCLSAPFLARQLSAFGVPLSSDVTVLSFITFLRGCLS